MSLQKKILLAIFFCIPLIQASDDKKNYSKPLKVINVDNLVSTIEATTLISSTITLSVLAHELSHSLMHKIFTGTFGDVHICATFDSKPIVSFGKIHLHAGAPVGGYCTYPNQNKMSPRQQFLRTLAGPIGGIISSHFFQIALQAYACYQETKNLNSSLKQAIKNTLSPLQSIVNNKAFSPRRKRSLIMASGILSGFTLHQLFYGFTPSLPTPLSSIGGGDGEKVYEYIWGKKPSFNKVKFSTSAMMFTLLVIYSKTMMALGKVNAQEEKVLDAALQKN